MIINCPNCEGKGHLIVWDFEKPAVPPAIFATKHIDCGWCQGAKQIDDKTWIDYQPHRQRPKEILDIMLRDGDIVEGCYPNADSWNPLVKAGNPKNFGPIKDYRVIKVKMSKYNFGNLE